MRIRSIKPEFWRSEDIAELSIPTRLLFIGLWSYVDDNGVGRDDDALIMADLFPRDMSRDFSECSLRVHGGLSELSNADLVVRYEAEYKGKTQRFLYIPTWADHQKVNRPATPRYPQYDAIQHTLIEASVSPHDTLTEDSVLVKGLKGEGLKGAGEQVMHTSASPEDAQRVPSPYTDQFETFWAAYPIRKGKARAYKAFKEAIKKASLEQILAGVEAYKADLARTGNTKIKYAEGWLTGERWNDEYTPVMAPPSRVGSWLEAGAALEARQAEQAQIEGGAPW